MNLEKIVSELGFNVYTEKVSLSTEITGGYTSDLLSDVMGRSKAGNLWITLQTHKNVVAVASLRDLAAVVLVNGLKPDPDMLEQAARENIPILGTSEGAFVISGKLFNLLHKEK